MKNLKNVLAIVIFFSLILSMSTIVSAAEPRAQVLQCPDCIVGQVTTITQRTYEHDEQFDCKHGYDEGYDLYAAYEVIKTTSCDKCSFEKVYKVTEHVFKACYGH